MMELSQKITISQRVFQFRKFAKWVVALYLKVRVEFHSSRFLEFHMICIIYPKLHVKNKKYPEKPPNRAPIQSDWIQVLRTGKK